MDVKYINSYGEELILTKWPYIMPIESLFDYEWEQEAVNTGGKGGRILKFRRSVTEIYVEIAIHAHTYSDFQDALNQFFSATEKDVLSKSPGRLELPDGQYLTCYITGSKNTLWSRGTPANIKNAKIVTEYPFWCKDVQTEYRSDNTSSESGYEFLDYPYDYPYDYAPNTTGQFLDNDFFGSCDFEMRIFGPATNPKVIIGNMPYEVKTTVYLDEFLVINSRERTVIRYKPDGTRVNEFNNKVGNIFEPIPPGKHFLEKGSVAALDVILYQERSEPRWNLG